MPPYPPIDDTELVKMYESGAPITEITSRFNIHYSTLYAHLRKCNVGTNRHKSKSWSEAEYDQLIAARHDGCTGQEYESKIPTRTWAAIKSQIVKLRRTGRL